MIELVNVEVTNFRSFSTATFSPLGIGQGLTAINGANGMGKSTIVHAILWALYGITPDGVRVGALRRQGSEGDVEARVTFRHDGQTIEVTRALRGKNDTTVASISLEGVEQTNVSAKTATAWVTNRLGLDAEAFLTAFVVRQKELDSLVRARPADRRKTIERLAGIERMSAALDRARTDARQAQRLLDALPESLDPADAQEAVDEATSSLTLAQQEYESASHLAAQVAEAASEDAEAVNGARKALASVTTAQHALDLAEQKLSTAQDSLRRMTAEAADAALLDSATTAAEAAQSARANAEQAVRSATEISTRASELEEEAAYAEVALDQARERVATATQKVQDLREEYGQIPTTVDADYEAASEASRHLADEKGAARGEWDRLTKAITTLKENAADHSASCPTCNHAIPDPAELIDVLTVSLDTVQARGKQLALDLAHAEQRVSELSGLVNRRATLGSQIELATEAVATAQTNVTQAAEKAERARATATAAAEKAAHVRAEADTAAAALPQLRIAEKNAQEALRRAETAARAAAELPQAKNAHENAEAEVRSAQQTLRSAQERAKEVDLSLAEEAARISAQEAAATAEKAAAARTAHLMAQRDLAEAQAAYDRATTATENRKLALAEVERATAVAGALDEFRRDRLARLTPELSEVASDFVARMTDGKYTSVVLDEDFTPILTDASGAERPVAWLSGGEESAVALALRVAIGEVLAGQRGGMLVLDEVLTAQDPMRRQSTMGAIRALPRQIITINHVSEATDMVDLVAEVIPDGEGASTIMDIAPDGPLGANVSDALLDE